MKPSIIFLSRVSSEFGALCGELLSTFNSTEFAPFFSFRDQIQDVPITEGEVEIGLATLVKLVSWIKGCRECFHFVGRQSGAVAKYPDGDLTDGVLEVFERLGLGDDKAAELNAQIVEFTDSTGYPPGYVQLEFLIASVLLGRKNIRTFWVEEEGLEVVDDQQQRYREWLENKKVKGFNKIVALKSHFASEVEKLLLRMKSGILAGMVLKPGGGDFMRTLAGLASASTGTLSLGSFGESIRKNFREVVVNSLSEKIRWIKKDHLKKEVRTLWRIGDQSTQAWCLHLDEQVYLIIIDTGGGVSIKQMDLEISGDFRAVCLLGEDYWVLFEQQGGSQLSYQLWSLGSMNRRHYPLDGFSPTGLEPLELFGKGGEPSQFIITQANQIWELVLDGEEKVKVIANCELDVGSSSSSLLGRQILEPCDCSGLDLPGRTFGGREVMDFGGCNSRFLILREASGRLAVVSLSELLPVANLFKIYDFGFSSVITFGAIQQLGDSGSLPVLSDSGTELGKVFLGGLEGKDKESLPIVDKSDLGLVESLGLDSGEKFQTKVLRLSRIIFYLVQISPGANDSRYHERVVVWAIPEVFSEKLILGINRMILDIEEFPQSRSGSLQKKPSEDSWWGELLNVTD